MIYPHLSLDFPYSLCHPVFQCHQPFLKEPVVSWLKVVYEHFKKINVYKVVRLSLDVKQAKMKLLETGLPEGWIHVKETTTQADNATDCLLSVLYGREAGSLNIVLSSDKKWFSEFEHLEKDSWRKTYWWTFERLKEQDPHEFVLEHFFLAHCRQRGLYSTWRKLSDADLKIQIESELESAPLTVKHSIYFFTPKHYEGLLRKQEVETKLLESVKEDMMCSTCIAVKFLEFCRKQVGEYHAWETLPEPTLGMRVERELHGRRFREYCRETAGEDLSADILLSLLKADMSQLLSLLKADFPGARIQEAFRKHCRQLGRYSAWAKLSDADLAKQIESELRRHVFRRLCGVEVPETNAYILSQTLSIVRVDMMRSRRMAVKFLEFCREEETSAYDAWTIQIRSEASLKQEIESVFNGQRFRAYLQDTCGTDAEPPDISQVLALTQADLMRKAFLEHCHAHKLYTAWKNLSDADLAQQIELELRSPSPSVGPGGCIDQPMWAVQQAVKTDIPQLLAAVKALTQADLMQKAFLEHCHAHKLYTAWKNLSDADLAQQIELELRSPSPSVGPGGCIYQPMWTVQQAVKTDIPQLLAAVKDDMCFMRIARRFLDFCREKTNAYDAWTIQIRSEASLKHNIESVFNGRRFRAYLQDTCGTDAEPPDISQVLALTQADLMQKAFLEHCHAHKLYTAWKNLSDADLAQQIELELRSPSPSVGPGGCIYQPMWTVQQAVKTDIPQLLAAVKDDMRFMRIARRFLDYCREEVCGYPAWKNIRSEASLKKKHSARLQRTAFPSILARHLRDRCTFS